MTVAEGMGIVPGVDVIAGVIVIVGKGVVVGAGAGGGVEIGRALTSPVTMANWPQSQHTSPGRRGFWMIQYVLSAFRPTTCAT